MELLAVQTFLKRRSAERNDMLLIVQVEQRSAEAFSASFIIGFSTFSSVEVFSFILFSRPNARQILSSFSFVYSCVFAAEEISIDGEML